MRKIFFIALAVSALALTSCEKNEPFDTHTLSKIDIECLISKEELSTGDPVSAAFLTVIHINRFSVIEDQVSVFIHQLFLLTLGGSVTVHPYEADPYSAAPAAGRHFVPGSPATINGANLSKVTELIVSRDIFFKDIVCTITEFTGDDASLTFTLPETADGRYFLRLKDAEGKTYGADAINVHNAAVILAGYQEFTPGAAWTITGVKLENVASVIVDGTPITDLTVTSTSITLVAPEAEVGNHTLSVKNADGSNVYFITDAGLVTEVTTIVSAEITFWSGEVNIDWNADLLRVPASQLAEIPAGATIAVYYTVPAAEYHALRITNPAWSSDFLPQVDGMAEQPNPYTFEFTENSKALIDGGQDFCVVGFGLTITKITYK